MRSERNTLHRGPVKAKLWEAPITGSAMEQRLEERLAYQLARTEHELRVVLDNALRDLGVTLTQWTVLTFLVREPGLSAADLARRSFISQQGVAGILARLERAG